MRPPLIIAGMHHSGSSVVASHLASLGIDLGSEPLTDAAEQTRFASLQRQMLLECTYDDDGGYREWGWTESEYFNNDPLEKYRASALKLLEQRAGTEFWGWQDPATSLLLNFWNELCPKATFLFVYRSPWDVADSIQRLALDVFLANPDYPYRIWVHYNRQLLSFFRRFRNRTALVSYNALLENPRKVQKVLRKKLGLKLDKNAFREIAGNTEYTTRAADDPLIAHTAASLPGCTSVLRELDRAADLGGSKFWRAGGLDSAGAGAENNSESVKLSVVLACFNHGQSLIEAIASVERCQLTDHELIIVNNGSTEERTLEVLGVLKDAGYRIIDHAQQGLAEARNTAIEAARGLYILPLDPDDCLRPDFPATAIGILDASPNIGVVFGDCQEFGESHERLFAPENAVAELTWRDSIEACAVFRREIWHDVGGFDPKTAPLDHWDLFIGARELGWEFHQLPEVTHERRIRPTNEPALNEEPVRLQGIVNRIVTKRRNFYQRLFLDRIGNIAAWPLWFESERAALYTDRARIQGELDQALAEIEELRRELSGLTR